MKKPSNLAAEQGHLDSVRLLLQAERGQADGRAATEEEFVQAALQRAKSNEARTCRLENPQSYARHAGFFSAEHAQELVEKGIVVIDAALSPTEAAALHREMAQLHANGFLQETLQSLTRVRLDKVRWLSETDAESFLLKAPCPSISQSIRVLKGVAAQLNSTLNLRLLVQPQAMVSCYPGEGTYYKPHRDNEDHVGCHWCSLRGSYVVTGNPWRQVTAVLYANPPDWDSTVDGGCLRCYTGSQLEDDTGTTSQQTRDVQPIGGRIVLFWSAHMVHEVLPAYRERYALTLWMNGSQTQQ
mmetsp:Transcript_18540/g.40571  ORF Transcript_18540/g.40571 Transcript_18540/m.40571 type:complete len:299 (-) Transcript_18540:314-1210(-)